MAIVRRALQGCSGLPGYRGAREDSRVALAPESTDETAVAVVRPDGYTGMIAPLGETGAKEILDYFSGFMKI